MFQLVTVARKYGSRRRSVSRSERKQLKKNDLGTIEGYLPPVAPGEDFSHEAYVLGRPRREEFTEKYRDLLKKQEKPTIRNLVGFLGDFLSLLREARSGNQYTESKELSERFVSRLDKDNKKKFHTSLRGLTYGSGKSDDKKLDEGKKSRDIDSPPTIGALSGEPGVKQAVAESIFQNVNMITNLDVKYFNNFQRLVFAQLGIEIEDPSDVIHEEPKSTKKGRIPSLSSIRRAKKKQVKPNKDIPVSETVGSPPMEETQVITIAQMVGYVDKLKTDEEGQILDGRGMAIEVFDILKKMDPDEEEDKLRKRAQLIARDQTQKVFNALDTARGKDNGFYWYIWSASGGDSPDNRVRDTHRKNNGKVFHIDHEPKNTGHPGHDVNCRCRKKWVYLKSDVAKITRGQLGYTDAGQLNEVAKLLPGN